MSQLNHEINNKKIYLFVILTLFLYSKILPRDLESLFFFSIRVNKNFQNQAIETHIYMYGFHQTVILTP